MAAPLQLIPETAPFSPAQRAWLNGFFAGLLALNEEGSTSPAPAAETEDHPWHDSTLALDERMKLAEGRTYPLQLMAAMGQLDCGQCGYQCRTYAAAIADGSETDLSLCSPGGRATAKKLRELTANPPATATPAPATTATTGAVVSMWSRKNPFRARLIESRPLCGHGSVKDIRHIAIDLAGSGLSYEPGDALGVIPRNDPALVDLLLARFEALDDEAARRELTEARDITRPGDGLIELLLGLAQGEDALQLRALLEDGPERGEDVLDLLDRFPAIRPPLAEFVAALDKLQPRLYSIASSRKAHPGEVHLTVGVVRYHRGDRQRSGVASSFLAERVAAGDEIGVYVQQSHGFRLPADGSRPILMVGPGTGIAPFRAFLEERRATGATGRAWLFFGNPNADSDFLYHAELEGYLADGTLTRLTTAFSRDQAQKIYVQHRLLERGAEVWEWLGQEGAYFYVCGDATYMAPDVERALLHIARDHGGMGEEKAAEWIKKLAAEGRYLKDVY